MLQSFRETKELLQRDIKGKMGIILENLHFLFLKDAMDGSNAKKDFITLINSLDTLLIGESCAQLPMPIMEKFSYFINLEFPAEHQRLILIQDLLGRKEDLKELVNVILNKLKE